jgi:DMSO/TMAO reductase YedYZ molybdopterin-dependent catalytic subunit
MISQFANWRLTVDGLGRKQLSLSLDEIKELPGAHAGHPAQLRRGLL